MNFCDKSDLYISLYIDEQLELKEKEEFEKHLKKCTQCARKLKEESYFVQLCKEDEDIILPKDFSASLHSRLVEISREDNNKTNPNNKIKSFFLNRKLMASISTAAVIVLSLLAYGLIPEFGSGMEKASSVNESAVIQEAAPEARAGTGSGESAVVANDSSEDVNSTLSGSSADNTAGVSDGGGQKTADSKENTIAGITEFKVEKGSEQAADNRKLKVKAYLGQPVEDSVKYGAATHSDDSSNSPEKENENAKAKADEEIIMGFAMPDDNTSNVQYFTNYVEMTLAIESGEAEMESLKKLMTEYGASEQSSGMLQGFSANLKDNAAYVEYSISLGDYVTLQSEAKLKYKLELKAKTDIIKKDITEEYNCLENKLNELENKINEAINIGEDITTLETEKSSLIGQINSLIARQEMITIRIFFVKK